MVSAWRAETILSSKFLARNIYGAAEAAPTRAITAQQARYPCCLYKRTIARFVTVKAQGRN